MLPIKDAKPTKIGNSHYFSIPAAYISNGAIDPKKEFEIIILKKTDEDLLKVIYSDKRKPIKLGGYYILIPSNYINDHQIILNNKYDIIINSVDAHITCTHQNLSLG